MGEIENKRQILLKNKSHILRMANNKKKVEMLQAYFSLLNYYQIVTGDEMFDEQIDIDDDFTRKYVKYLANDTIKNIMILEKNTSKLYKKYQHIIDIYKKNEFCRYDYIGHIKVNKDKMLEAISNFFYSLDIDVLKIYNKMVLENNIFLNSLAMDRLGYAMDASLIDNACITIQNIPNYLDFYITLAHEIGHCYQFYLQRNQNQCAMFDPYCEITSMLFEKLFVLYLKNNYLIKDTFKIDFENYIGFLNTVSLSKQLCELFINDKIMTINPYNLSYNCHADIENIKKSIIDDCGYIEPFMFDLDFTNFHYAFGQIISRYFAEILKNDFNTEWRNFKNFICTIRYLPMSEVIDTYFNVDLIDEDIKTLTKSYRKR